MMRVVGKFILSAIALFSLFGYLWAENNTVGIRDIQHTKKNKIVNLTRDVTSGNNQADMFLRTEDSGIFKLISTIDTFSKATSLQVTGNGNYVVKFLPSGGGKEMRYAFSITGIDSQQKDIPAVPKTGTTSNILLVLGIATLLYTFYRYRKVVQR